jgi:hypothetical protein
MLACTIQFCRLRHSSATLPLAAGEPLACSPYFTALVSYPLAFSLKGAIFTALFRALRRLVRKGAIRTPTFYASPSS